MPNRIPPAPPEDLAGDFLAFERRLAASGILLERNTMEALKRYGEVLAERSKALNLVSSGDRGRIYTRHVFESLVPGLLARAKEAGRLVDVGSGAGLPGIPLALACPDLEALLVEPRLRRAQFLEATVAGFGLARRVEVFHGTVEKHIDAGVGPGAGLVTARAVGSLPRVWGWALDLLAPGGWLGVFKGPSEVEEEIARIQEPVPSATEVHAVPGAPRVLLLLQKPVAS